MDSQELNRAVAITDEQVAEIFDYHKWDDEKVAKGKAVRESIGQAFKAVIENIPPCADRTVALRKLREARMDANSALTHGGKF